MSIAIGAAAACLLYVAWFFNACVRLRNKTRDAFAGIDVQLKRRHDLVPNLVEVVGAYARHERDTLTEVTRMRGEATAAGSLPERERTEDGLSRSLDRLLVLVERYPELRADESFRKLQDDLVEVEDHIQYARRYYNACVRDFNTRIEQFPGNLVAAAIGFRREPFFQLETAGERRPPDVEGLA